MKFVVFSYNELHQTFENFKAQCECIDDDDKNDYQPPAKRPRKEISGRDISSYFLHIPENSIESIDPVKLPEPCRKKIFQTLTRKELIEATEVSKNWKGYIESRSKLMRPALEETIVKIDFDQEKLSEISSYRFVERNYKHMVIWPYNSSLLRQTISSMVLYPAFELSSTLKTLTIRLNLDVACDFFQKQFPKLVKLEIDDNSFPFNKVPEGSFPELTTLLLECNTTVRDPVSISTFKKFLGAFPKLQHLQIKSYEPNDFLYDDFQTWGSVPEPSIEDLTQPTLETISFPPSFRYFPKFLRSHQNSLTKLLVGEINAFGLSICLNDLKQLKILIVSKLHSFGAAEIMFPRNESVECLKIFDNFLDSDEFHQVLIAFSSLKELAVNYIVDEYRVDIRFIGM